MITKAISTRFIYTYQIPCLARIHQDFLALNLAYLFAGVDYLLHIKLSQYVRKDARTECLPSFKRENL